MFIKMRINYYNVRNIYSYNVKLGATSNFIQSPVLIKKYSTKTYQDSSPIFETVFSFPFVRYIATLNRMKTYHLLGTSLALPGSYLLETMSVLPEYSYLAASYIGVTGGILLSLASLPFNNAIGFLYISKDNRMIKISYVDFWGRRKDNIVPADDWIPLLDMKQKTMDAIYLSPQLTNGTKYKLFIKFGKVLNSTKMGEVLE